MAIALHTKNLYYSTACAAFNARLFAPQMHIAEFLKPEAVIADFHSVNKDGILTELATALALVTPQVPVERLLFVLSEREKVESTGMGDGVAIPHGRLPELMSLSASFGLSRAGVNFGARDGHPSKFFFALVAPENAAGVHLKALSKISLLFRSNSFREALFSAKTSAELYTIIAHANGQS